MLLSDAQLIAHSTGVLGFVHCSHFDVGSKKVSALVLLTSLLKNGSMV